MMSNVQGPQEAGQEHRDWGQQETTQSGKELSPHISPSLLASISVLQPGQAGPLLQCRWGNWWACGWLSRLLVSPVREAWR